MFKKLRKLGVLGMNARVGQYMNALNARKNYPKVDDKVLTAELAERFQVPMPKSIALLTSPSDLRDVQSTLAELNSFVLKPARGAMGNGIIVIKEIDNDVYRKSSGIELSLADIKYHASQIISGLFSLSGFADVAIIQEKIELHPEFKKLAFQGIPDLRFIVFKGKPVMAMLRLPTKESDGRANLHQGALGVGIDLNNGMTTTAIHHNRIIESVPDTGIKITDIKLPHFKQALDIAKKSFEMTGLGYLGVDIVIDKTKGPMLLELNARPGLSIQVANQIGLLNVLK